MLPLSIPPITVLPQIYDASIAVFDEVEDVLAAEAIALPVINDTQSALESPAAQGTRNPHSPRPIPRNHHVRFLDQLPQLLPITFRTLQVQIAIPLSPYHKSAPETDCTIAIAKNSQFKS